MAKVNNRDMRFHGTFQLPSDISSFGELVVDGRRTLLNLSSQSELPLLRSVGNILGVTLDGKRITCIDCVGSSQGRSTMGHVVTSHYAHVFPHYVVIGDEHVDTKSARIQRISFTVDDIASLFYDFDAFGFVIDASKVIDSVLEQQSRIRQIKAGEWPEVAYFTGRFTVAELDSAIGKIAVRHRPTSNMGGPDGFYMKNTMYVSIEPDHPVSFESAMDRVACVSHFLSMVAGRVQGATDIQISLAGYADDRRRNPLRVHWSYAPKTPNSSDSERKPHPGDVPLDPIQRRDEFISVITYWIERDSGRRTARVRYLSCLQKGNSYGVDRLVAAANMFDVLPPEATPAPVPLPDDLSEARSTILSTLKKLPQSQDRDSAISAIARMGKPSLPKKVAHRTRIVTEQVDSAFPDLDYVIRIALSCRNYFVHGGGPKAFDFKAAEPFVPFLTDALEFVFSASDLIEAGWDASRWNQEPHGTGHNFARFRWGYKETVAQLKQAMAT
ncbi:HEPN domain-containing protein [Rhodanobacter spathiphylli]|uniref:Uncharacterized protein n=1 Tax=Rhodanobacter spathiphylli B39 TaxID=1163407 RepID=I4VRI3_9GAMM|nr:HEPN domain-containing protein [Rhodanobacter spathiphylli]EIL89824.1 hypothetical protein UU7_16347 [Rhodanobacter spathiphylli B39]